MEDQQALDIVSALANGANPVSGEVFAADSPYQNPAVIRALFAAQRALEFRLHAGRDPKAQATSTGGGRPVSSTNAGKSWSPDEDKQLLAAFDAELPLSEIARSHARTVGGVRARLEKHGRLEPATARWPHGTKNSDLSNGSGPPSVEPSARPRQSRSGAVT